MMSSIAQTVNESVINSLITVLCQIYCEGPILDAVQKAYLFPDSKYFVDMPLKRSSNETLKAFFALGNQINDEDILSNFVDENFNPPGSELEQCLPEDWTQFPDFLEEKLPDPLNEWLFELHTIWLGLCRKVKEEVGEKQELYSLLYVPHPFIVPGGRFREFYYWDTFWTIKGLLISNMFSTARGMIKNLAYMVEMYGFIPNGGRVYFLFRSQPPLFINMVYEYVNMTGDIDFAAELMPAMEKEFSFWLRNRSIHVVDQWYSFRYKSDMRIPRPESYREDIEMVEHVNSQTKREWTWAQIASGAETGWDFSSRWFSRSPPNAYRMKSIRTWSIIPADLNSFMCMNARILAKLNKDIGNLEKHDKYEWYFTLARKVLKYVHWNEKDGIWYDYDLEKKEHIKAYYISNAIPLYSRCFDNQNVPMRVYKYMENMGAFSSARSIPTSFIKSGEQWDGENAWAPLIHMIIEGFQMSGNPDLEMIAERYAVNWLMLTYQSYTRTRSMFEKYNTSMKSDMPYGGGGEYEVQTGFGWTNGVTMTFLLKYASAFERELKSGTSAVQPSNVKSGYLRLYVYLITYWLSLHIR
uniref:Trehalase n=1 Tax=Trichuris muris TaxID=70415 RepID=A0A5S6QFV1_TRIMR